MTAEEYANDLKSKMQTMTREEAVASIALSMIEEINKTAESKSISTTAELIEIVNEGIMKWKQIGDLVTDAKMKKDGLKNLVTIMNPGIPRNRLQ